VTRPIGVALLLVAMFFVYRSFYGMRISSTGAIVATEKKAAA
jgi:hypothetical protein